MNPPDSPHQTPDDFSAALAAMRREWAEVRAHQPLYHPKLPEEDRYEAAVRQMAIFRAFLHRHRTVLAAPALTEQDREPLEAARLLQIFLDASEKVHRREEKALQLSADLADCFRDLVLECLRKLAWLESMPQEEWDAMPPDRRVNLNAILDACARPAKGCSAPCPSNSGGSGRGGWGDGEPCGKQPAVAPWVRRPPAP